MSIGAASQWDVFISHASEDKIAFVKPLASALRAFGVKVWYDEYELRLGDSLTRSIDRGLATSKFGIVVLSPSFIAKRWPEYELSGLIAREMSSDDKVVLPIWYKLTRADLLSYSPALADKIAVDASNLTPVQTAFRVIEAARPDLAISIKKRIAHHTRISRAKIQSIDPRTISIGPILHNELPDELLGRIRLFRAALLPIYPQSMEYWVSGFQRDSHPTKEVVFWERLAATWLEFLAVRKLDKTKEKTKIAFHALLSLALGCDADEFLLRTTGLNPETIMLLLELSKSKMPLDKIEGKADPFEGKEVASDEYIDRIDIERFPEDLPENLIRELLKSIK